MIKKADIILAILLLISGLISTFVLASGGETGQTVEISVKGESFATYDLLENHQVTINKSGRINKITIKDGTVAMVSSNCAGQDCIHQGEISRTSQTIACLPHQILIEIKGKNQAYDSISH